MALLVPPTGKPTSVNVLLERLDLGLVRQQELHVVAAREAQVAVAVVVGQLGEHAQRLHAQQTRRAAANRVDPIAGMRHVAQDARREVLVVLPLAVVLLDDRMQELLVVRRPDIRNPLDRCCCHGRVS